MARLGHKARPTPTPWREHPKRSHMNNNLSIGLLLATELLAGLAYTSHRSWAHWAGVLTLLLLSGLTFTGGLLLLLA